MYRTPDGLAVDVAVIGESPGDEGVVLIKRKNDPYKNMWALPGGFTEEGESLEEAARRELREETGLYVADGLHQVGAYWYPGRDPRGWIPSVLYIVLLQDLYADMLKAQDDAKEVIIHDLFPIIRSDKDFPMAFDHRQLILDAMDYIS